MPPLSIFRLPVHQSKAQCHTPAHSAPCAPRRAPRFARGWTAHADPPASPRRRGTGTHRLLRLCAAPSRTRLAASNSSRVPCALPTSTHTPGAASSTACGTQPVDFGPVHFDAVRLLLGHGPLEKGAVEARDVRQLLRRFDVLVVLLRRGLLRSGSAPTRGCVRRGARQPAPAAVSTRMHAWDSVRAGTPARARRESAGSPRRVTHAPCAGAGRPSLLELPNSALLHEHYFLFFSLAF